MESGQGITVYWEIFVVKFFFVGVINHENLKHEIKFTLGKF